MCVPCIPNDGIPNDGCVPCIPCIPGVPCIPGPIDVQTGMQCLAGVSATAVPKQPVSLRQRQARHTVLALSPFSAQVGTIQLEQCYCLRLCRHRQGSVACRASRARARAAYRDAGSRGLGESALGRRCSTAWAERGCGRAGGRRPRVAHDIHRRRRRRGDRGGRARHRGGWSGLRRWDAAAAAWRAARSRLGPRGAGLGLRGILQHTTSFDSEG